jgi:hypothetical protein
VTHFSAVAPCRARGSGRESRRSNRRGGRLDGPVPLTCARDGLRSVQPPLSAILVFSDLLHRCAGAAALAAVADAAAGSTDPSPPPAPATGSGQSTPSFCRVVHPSSVILGAVVELARLDAVVEHARGSAVVELAHIGAVVELTLQVQSSSLRV